MPLELPAGLVKTWANGPFARGAWRKMVECSAASQNEMQCDSCVHTLFLYAHACIPSLVNVALQVFAEAISDVQS